jgi:hypothetical protein
MAIQNLDNVDSISPSTLFAVNQNGLDYNCTAAVVADFIEQNVTVNDGKVIQYSSPISGSTVAISGTNNSVWLVLTPTRDSRQHHPDNHLAHGEPERCGRRRRSDDSRGKRLLHTPVRAGHPKMVSRRLI